MAARCASGWHDLLILHDGCDSSGDFGVERGAELGQVQVDVDTAELVASLDHAGGDQRSAICPSRQRLTLAE